MKIYSLLTVFLCLFSINTFNQSLIQSGPMLGYTDMRESAVWVQTKSSASVQLLYWPKGQPTNSFKSETQLTQEKDAFTALLIANQVEPGNIYEYRIVVNGSEIVLPYKTEFQTQAIWKWRNDPPEFSFAAGSCAYINEEKYDRPGTPYGADYEIFKSIHKSSPDMMVWLGDNTYLREADWNTRTGILKRWTHTRSIDELQPLLASTHNYAIWDDHDYGPNNSDRGYWNKNNSFDAFKLFWANPSYGIGETPGVFTQFQWADVDFFLLDNRYYRSPNEIQEPHKTILGDKQKQWLKDALISSNGSFKIIAMGGQFLNDAGLYEQYSNNGFEQERQEIIDFIYKHQLKNIIFLTGDRHHSELNILKATGKPQIIELTVSPLTSGVSKNENENNSLRVKETFVSEHNYALISFKGSYESREMHIQLNNKNGELIWKKTVTTE